LAESIEFAALVDVAKLRWRIEREAALTAWGL
jgi:hypothetical protein